MYFRNRIPSQLAVDDSIRAPSDLVLPVVTGPSLKVHQWLPSLLPGIRIVDVTRENPAHLTLVRIWPLLRTGLDA